MIKPVKWECPLDIFAHHLNYPPAFTAWLKAREYAGYNMDSKGRPEVGHKILFGTLNPKTKAK
jgi:hypothetical protein